VRRECLDHVIVLDEQHLSSILDEFVAYYNQERSASNARTPDAHPSAPSNDRRRALTSSAAPRVRARSLNGLGFAALQQAYASFKGVGLHFLSGQI